MNNYRWVSVLGDFESTPTGLIFKGGTSEIQGRTGSNVGNFICDQVFGGGTITGTITFRESVGDAACGFMIYYHPETGGFVTSQLGGGFLCSVGSYSGHEWTNHGGQGPQDQLRPDTPYQFQVDVAGSRVRITLDGVRVITTNLPFPLPKGQVGIWAAGRDDICVERFQVIPEQPKMFVVMQFTDQYNELYRDVIVPTGKDLGFAVVRADETYGPGIVVADIAQQIVESKVIVADITPNNPNVYWEVGYAHALNKPTILIAERSTRLPFDVSPFRTLFYDNTIAGKAKIEVGLRKHVQAIESAWQT